MKDLNIGLPFRPFQTQMDIALSRERVSFVGGAYGSGKSMSAAFAIFMLAIENPWRIEYGENNPTIVVSAPTARIMRDTTLPAIRKVIPEECIKKFRISDNEMLLNNGCVIKFRSGKSKFEGLTILGIWIDECSLYDEQFFHNAIARVRDPMAVREKIIVSGIPFEGTWVEDQFRLPKPGQDSFMMSAFSNPFLPLRSIQELKNRISKSDAETLVHGRWMKQRDLIFPEFSMTTHVRPVPKRGDQQYFFGIDPGKNHSVCLVAQTFDLKLKDGTQAKGINIIDEIIMAKASVERLMQEVKARGYTTPTKGFVDPTTRIDEMNSIKRVFPNLPVVQQPHRSMMGSEDFGLDCVRSCLMDANDNVRLYISDNIRGHDEGLVRCLQTYKWNQRTEKPQWADDSGDHSVDSLRYLCVGLLPNIGNFKPFAIKR